MASNVSSNEHTFCTPCQLEKMSIEANGYCLECVETLCTNCMRDHRKNKASRSHAVVTASEDQTSSSVFKLLDEILKCQEHIGHPDCDIKHFCVDHSQYVCSVCLSTSHHTCKNVKDLKNEPTDFQMSKDLVKDVQEQFALFRQKSDKNKTHIEDRRTLIDTQRKSIAQKLHLTIDGLERQLVKETDTLLQSERMKLKTDRKTCNEMEETNTFLATIVSAMEGCELKSKQLLIAHEIVLKLTSVKEQLNSLISKPNPPIVFKEATYDLQSLGTVRNKLDYETGMSSVSLDDEGLESLPAHIRTLKADVKQMTQNPVPDVNISCQLEQTRRFSLTTKRVSPVAITGLAVLKNGWLVVYDGEIKAIEVVDHKGDSICHTPCNHPPLAMCTIKDSNIAVIYRGNNVVEQYHVTNTCITVVRHFFYKGNCVNITRHGNNVALLVSTGNGIRVEVRQYLDGKIVETLYIDTSNERTVFKNPSYLLFLGSGKYVVGGDNKANCFNKQGDKLLLETEYRYGNETLTSLTADDDSNVYMAYRNKGQIRRISTKRSVDTGNVLRASKDVAAIAFDGSQQLYVLSYGTNAVACYKIK